MDVSDSHTYAAPADAVIDMYADPDAAVARYEAMGHRDIEVLECRRTDESLRVRTSRVVDVDLPGFARKVLAPTNTMIQTDEWSRADDGTWDGAVDVEVKGAPVRMSASMRLVPGGEESTMHVTVSMSVKVPLVGGRIAEWAGKNDVPRTMAAEFDAGDAWLAGHT